MAYLPGNIFRQTLQTPDDSDAVLKGFNDYRKAWKLEPMKIKPHSYHVARQLVASYDKKKGDLRVAVLNYLESATQEQLLTLARLFDFMDGLPGMKRELKMRQGVIKPEEEWTEEERSMANDDMHDEVVREEWEWAHELADEAFMEKKSGVAEKVPGVWDEFKQSAREYQAKSLKSTKRSSWADSGKGNWKALAERLGSSSSSHHRRTATQT